MEESSRDGALVGTAWRMTPSRVGEEGSALPGGTVTLLLADLEGSVRLWESDRATMPAVAARLGEMISEAVGKHSGVRPVEQGEGDSFVAAFERASDAAACALELQLATRDEPWPGDMQPRFRMALHTGEAQFRDDSNYAGTFINRCARLRDIGHGGQILVSRATHDLVVDRLPEAATLTPMGAHRLRDLARPEDVFQLSHATLPAGFPALRSLDALPNNLPAQLTSFIGREPEMAEIKKLLDENRLVTLTGAGGSGKTRLAVQVAAELLDRFHDGVWWVDLAPVADPELVSGALASALAVTETAFQPVVETVAARIRDKSLLVILDNCEHLVSACAELVAGLVRACPAVVILATSREPLGVDGEVAWRVPSLSLPETRESPGFEALTQYEAVRLFIDRALRARPNFAVTNETAPAVAEICHRLDGIPLAIELAAARVRLFTPLQIAEGLSDRFRLLTGGARTAMPRQQTLEASVDWSFDLLGEDERCLLQRLSVFAGSFTLDAAEAVCPGDGLDRAAILDVLSRLVDRSLVQVEDAAPIARYRLLETIRQYGRRKLASAGESDVLRDHHLAYYVEWAGPPDMNWGAYHVIDTIDRHDLEIENLRAALDWAEAARRTDEGLRLGATLVWLWWARRGSEGQRRLETMLAASDGAPAVRIAAQIALAQTHWTLGTPFLGVPIAEEAAADARALGDQRLVGRALAIQGWCSLLSGGEASRTALAQALDALPEGDDYRSLAAAGLGGATFMSDDWPAAREHLQTVVPTPDGDADFAAELVELWLAITTIYQGDFADAHRMLDAAFVHGKRIGTLSPTIGFAWAFRALAHVWQGDIEQADEAIGTAMGVATEAGLPWIEWMTRLHLAFLEYGQGKYAEAQANIEQVLPLLLVLNERAMGLEALVLLAEVHRIRGDLASAQRRMSEALAVTKRVGHGPLDSFAALVHAAIAVAEGDLATADDLAHEALAGFVRLNGKSLIAEALDIVADVAAREESVTEAVRLFGAAEALRERLGYRWRSAHDLHEEALQSSRETLDPEAWETAWAEGAAMSLDEAVAYAARGRGERKRPSAGWASLTPTELDVVRLVAEGLTNKQIAERLFIATSTVKVHVSHIFGKLGVSTRSELAVQATRRQL